MPDILMVKILPSILIALIPLWRIEMNWRWKRNLENTRINYENCKAKVRFLESIGLNLSNKGFKKAFRKYMTADSAYERALRNHV